jgi:hypothetical protein
MNNTLINRLVIKRIAFALGDMNERVVYVGGAVTSLYIDDPAAEDVRPTQDLDLTMKIVGLSELEEVRKELVKRGFHQSHEDNVICRFRFKDIKVDVMATTPIGWAPGNEWFEEGFKHTISKRIDDISITILSLPYFLASKVSAFRGRGWSEPRISKDFEDIVYILNYSSTLKDQILRSDVLVKDYLRNAFFQILEDKRLQEAIIANLFYEHQIPRYRKIMAILQEICVMP